MTKEPDKENGLQEGDERRTFFSRLALGLSGLIGAIVALPSIGFVLGPVLRRVDDKWRAVGKVSDFEVGSTSLVEIEDSSSLPWAGVTARTGIWLRKESDTDFIAFSINCRHLGCPVRWLQDTELFMCPCHGGVYYKDGEVAAGPPPEPLARVPVRVQSGQVEVQADPIPLTLNE